jgi:mono/diheme cytochrome c family protein
LAKQTEVGLATSILKGRGAMPGFRRQLDETEARRILAEVNPLVVRNQP